jgi:hypothetical protein
MKTECYWSWSKGSYSLGFSITPLVSILNDRTFIEISIGLIIGYIIIDLGG